MLRIEIEGSRKWKKKNIFIFKSDVSFMAYFYYKWTSWLFKKKSKEKAKTPFVLILFASFILSVELVTARTKTYIQPFEWLYVCI